MKPKTETAGPAHPNVEPSPPGHDPHPATEEIGKSQAPRAPKRAADPYQLDRDEERRVNNGLHDGKRFLNR